MINFGARGHDVTDADTPEKLARGLAEYGVHNVQLALPRQFPDLAGAERINPGMGSYFRRVLGECGVDIAVLGCYINMTHPDDATRETLLRRFEAYLANARFFGAPVVASETGSVDADPGRFTEENFTEEMYQRSLASVRRLVAVGERFGAIVGVEPGANHPTAYTTPSGRTVRDGDQVEITRKALEAFGDRIVAVHIDDFTVDPDGGGLHRCNVDEGVMDVRGILEAVSAARPYIPVILEETRDEAIARTVRKYGSL
ncbi:TIM barrel protein [Bifidobacterium sp. SMB2]|uniref:TIM barrel protein n=1 Tax=Bifidobacterium saimiriisciurei TaxID=2661627 RepID=A0ABX0CA05_9BIFI|nr:MULTISPECIES: sugar phosphate isomerase/epimerase [Bifidobacterium]NEG95653.1 TIM barrel protein [Bifidobacterium sp. SMB2]NEH11966.1 TIM barrel protein [Bifidobacterium saimiriisciurei]